jgi:hypothetical protein
VRVLLAVLLLAPSSSFAGQASTLRAFLSVPVPERLEGALRERDYRVLGVAGFTVETPGVTGELARVYGILIIPGTSDGIESPEHGELNERARAYALEYNRALLGSVPSASRGHALPPNKSLQQTSAERGLPSSAACVGGTRPPVG